MVLPIHGRFDLSPLPKRADHSWPVQYVNAVVRQFEEMVEQSERQPLVLSIALHSFIFGQPHRLRALREGLCSIPDNTRHGSG